MSNMDRDDGRKTQKLYGCHFSFVLSKLIMDNGLEDLVRTQIPLSSPATIDPQAQDPELTGYILT